MISTAPERELSLAYPMGQFDASQGNGRTPERLEASHHCGASAFDRSMILLNDIVQVLVTSQLDILPLRILAPQKPKGHVALQVAFERDLARPPRQIRRESRAKECLCSGEPRSGRSRKSTVLPCLSTAR
jgi:hypothetical protein